MAALIRCCLHIDPIDMPEDDFYRAWGQVKYYLESVHSVKFS